MVPAGTLGDLVNKAQADDIKVQLDDILESLENKYPAKLQGLVAAHLRRVQPRRRERPGPHPPVLKDIFKQDHGGEDLIGRVYEYFIGEFASSEGKRAANTSRPSASSRLVAMLEPTNGIVFDPCCGSGGMFVQSDLFTKHWGQLSFYGQESKDFTYRLCRMNLFIHGIDGNIELNNSYLADQHAGLKADYLLANPPFNDGAKGENGWGANRMPTRTRG